MPLRDVPLFATFIPSKMFEYLAAGKAVIGAVAGEAGADPARGGRGRGAARRQRGARRGDQRRWPPTRGGGPPMGRQGRAYVERFFDRAEPGPPVPQDPRPAAGSPRMRLLVTGGQRLPRRVRAARGRPARARGASRWRAAAAAAGAVAARGATPLAGDLDDRRRCPAIFASARCEALVNLASLGFGHAPAIVAATAAAGIDRAPCSSPRRR